MPFMPDDNVSGNILGGERGDTDAILYLTRDLRSEDDRRAEEREQNAKKNTKDRIPG
jgi:hypothetical protein